MIVPQSRKLKALQAELEERKIEIGLLEVEIDEAKQGQLIQCVSCKKKSPLGKWGCFDQLYYVPPRGCIEGDYWTHTEYKLQCPKCQVYNRFLAKEDKEYLNRHHRLFVDLGSGSELPEGSLWINAS